MTAVGSEDHRFAPGKVMPCSNIACAPTLLQKLLNHSQGDTKAMANFGPGAFIVIIGVDDSLTKIQGERAHTQSLPRPPKMATLFIETL